MKNNSVLIGLATLLIGLGGGYALGAAAESDSANVSVASTVEHDDHDHDVEEDTHSHGEMVMVDAEGAPTVSIQVTEDAKMGWNISLDTENYTFTPENVNGVNVANEGHAHLYVDDEKVGRLYGSEYHYDKNFDGTKTFRVTLNANNHGEYAVDGQVIEAVAEVTHEAHD